VFKPGAIVAIHRPKRVTTWLGGNEPVLDVPGNLRVVVPQSIKIPRVCVSSTSIRTHGFHLNNVVFKVKSIDVIDCPCKGDFCGGLEMYKDGSIVTKCPCINLFKRTSGITLLMSILLKVNGGDDEDREYVVNDFTSRDFTNQFLSAGIPPGLTASMIQENEGFVNLFLDNVIEGIDQVNAGGGFEVSGWVRKGFQNDQGVSEGGSNTNTSQRVKSSELHLHLTSIQFDTKLIESNLTDLRGGLKKTESLRTRAVVNNTLDDDEKNDDEKASGDSEDA
jgi:hypothetical protein